MSQDQGVVSGASEHVSDLGTLRAEARTVSWALCPPFPSAQPTASAPTPYPCPTDTAKPQEDSTHRNVGNE